MVSGLARNVNSKRIRANLATSCPKSSQRHLQNANQNAFQWDLRNYGNWPILMLVWDHIKWAAPRPLSKTHARHNFKTRLLKQEFCKTRTLSHFEFLEQALKTPCYCIGPCSSAAVHSGRDRRQSVPHLSGAHNGAPSEACAQQLHKKALAIKIDGFWTSERRLLGRPAARQLY